MGTRSLTALRFPTPDWKPAPIPSVSNPHPLPALALILSIFAVWLGWTVGYLSGRTAERGSQLGRVLALAPQQDSLEAALQWVRGLGWPPKPPLSPRRPSAFRRTEPLRVPALPRWEPPPALLAAPRDTALRR